MNQGFDWLCRLVTIIICVLLIPSSALADPVQQESTSTPVSAAVAILMPNFSHIDLGTIATRREALRHYPILDTTEVFDASKVSRKKVLPPFLPGSTCVPADAKRLSTAFMVSGYDKSNCPKEDWLPAMALTDTPGRKILVNIGVNKGYNLAIWMNLFTPWNQIDAKLWQKELLIEQPLLGSDACGVCDDCKTSFDINTLKEIEAARIHRNPRLTLLAVDLNSKNLNSIYHILQRIETNALNHHDLHSVSVYNFHAAVSNRESVITIPNCYLGNEACSIGASVSNRIAKGTVEVNTISVDRLLEEFTTEYRKHSDQRAKGGKVKGREEREEEVSERRRLVATPSLRKGSLSEGKSRSQAASFRQIHRNSSLILPKENLPTFVGGPRIDLLMIDIEGYDALALQGSINQLSTRNVRCLIFEYHSFSPWDSIPLGPIIDSLDSYGYDCYFQGAGRLWKLSGCYTTDYEFHQWSNIMCIVRGDVWHGVIQPFVRK